MKEKKRARVGVRERAFKIPRLGLVGVEPVDKKTVNRTVKTLLHHPGNILRRLPLENLHVQPFIAYDVPGQ
jgi:hypothetical protein